MLQFVAKNGNWGCGGKDASLLNSVLLWAPSVPQCIYRITVAALPSHLSAFITEGLKLEVVEGKDRKGEVAGEGRVYALPSDCFSLFPSFFQILLHQQAMHFFRKRHAARCRLSHAKRHR